MTVLARTVTCAFGIRACYPSASLCFPPLLSTSLHSSPLPSASLPVLFAVSVRVVCVFDWNCGPMTEEQRERFEKDLPEEAWLRTARLAPSGIGMGLDWRVTQTPGIVRRPRPHPALHSVACEGFDGRHASVHRFRTKRVTSSIYREKSCGSHVTVQRKALYVSVLKEAARCAKFQMHPTQ